MYQASCYEEKDGKFRGIVVGTDDRPVLWTGETFKNETTAKRYARLKFEDALYKCNHQWGEWTEEHSEDTEWGGTEYISSCDCKKCGLRNYNIADKPSGVYL
jgi:hypothetical protein